MSAALLIVYVSLAVVEVAVLVAWVIATRRHRWPVRPSGTPASSSSRSQSPPGTGRETMGAAGAGTAAGMADLPTTRLRWLGSVRGPLFLPGPRRIPRHATPPMTRSQRPATNRDLTRK